MLSDLRVIVFLSLLFLWLFEGGCVVQVCKSTFVGEQSLGAVSW